MKTLTHPRLRPVDAAGEAFSGIVTAPGGAIATALTALLAVGWFVAMLGLTSTAAGAVATAFAVRLPTAVRITTSGSRLPAPPFPYPPAAIRRVEALSGVVATGVYWRVGLSQAVSARPYVTRRPPGRTVIAATPGFLAAAGAQLSNGRAFDAWDQARGAPLCLVGSALARSLGLTSLASQPRIYINNLGCVIAGYIFRSSRQPSILRSVVIPAAAAEAVFGPPDRRARPTLLIQTRPGAAGQVARLAPFAISQTSPQRFAARVNYGPALLRRHVAGALSGLMTAAAWTGVAAGALAIGGLAMFCGWRRLPEYALRRALGARRRHIVAHALAESAVPAIIGGLAGASLGVAVVVLAALVNHWTPVIAPLLLWPTPLAGAAAAMIGWLVPAVVAALARPADGLARLAQA
ncbi:MAG TPA: ABC transporter permease [Streptosporangiaceae bacterium]|nr:ABC transporter permease [Streptosporangiaceae bacterium]